MMIFQCHSDTKSVKGFRFKAGTTWSVLLMPGAKDNMVILSQIEAGKIARQEIISVDKLNKCFWRIA